MHAPCFCLVNCSIRGVMTWGACQEVNYHCQFSSAITRKREWSDRETGNWWVSGERSSGEREMDRMIRKQLFGLAAHTKPLRCACNVAFPIKLTSRQKKCLFTCWKFRQSINPYAAGTKFDQYKMLQKNWKITKTLAYGTHLRVLSESYPMNTIMTSLHPCALDQSSLSIGRVTTTRIFSLI